MVSRKRTCVMCDDVDHAICQWVEEGVLGTKLGTEDKAGWLHASNLFSRVVKGALCLQTAKQLGFSKTHHLD